MSLADCSPGSRRARLCCLALVLALGLLPTGCSAPRSAPSLTGHNSVLVRAGLKGHESENARLIPVDAATGQTRALPGVGWDAQWIPGTDSLLHINGSEVLVRGPDGPDTRLYQTTSGWKIEDAVALGPTGGAAWGEMHDRRLGVADRGSRLVLVDREGKVRPGLPSGGGSFADVALSDGLSPDGRYLLCSGIVRPANGQRKARGWYLWDVVSGQCSRLPDQPREVWPDMFRWRPQPMELWTVRWSTAPGQPSEMHRLRFPGGAPGANWERVTWVPEGVNVVMFAPNGDTALAQEPPTRWSRVGAVGLLDLQTHTWRYRTGARTFTADFCERGCHLALIASQRDDPFRPFRATVQIIETRTGRLLAEVRLPGVLTTCSLDWGYPYYFAATSATPTTPTTEGSAAARPSKRDR